MQINLPRKVICFFTCTGIGVALRQFSLFLLAVSKFDDHNEHDCIFTGNTYLAGFGNEIKGGKNPNPFDFLQLANVQMAGNIEIEKDQSKKNYLQLKEGSFGSTLKAGLFRKTAAPQERHGSYVQ